jgi:hypothetical protein
MNSETGTIIAKYDLSQLASQKTDASATIKKENYGVCTLYVCAENMEGKSVTITKLISK